MSVSGGDACRSPGPPRCKLVQRPIHLSIIGAVDLVAQGLFRQIPGPFQRAVRAGGKLVTLSTPAPLHALIGIEGQAEQAPPRFLIAERDAAGIAAAVADGAESGGAVISRQHVPRQIGAAIDQPRIMGAVQGHEPLGCVAQFLERGLEPGVAGGCGIILPIAFGAIDIDRQALRLGLVLDPRRQSHRDSIGAIRQIGAIGPDHVA